MKRTKIMYSVTLDEKIMINPKIKLAQESLKLAIKIMTEIGLTPSSASRILSNLSEMKDVDDEFFS
jgi:phage terminase small subunit